jgi:hypothetical protein
MNRHWFYDTLEPTPEPYPEELLVDAKTGEIVFGKRGQPLGVRLYDGRGEILTEGIFLRKGDTISFETEVTIE